MANPELGNYDVDEALVRAAREDVTVYKSLGAGESHSAVICRLVEDKKALFKRLMELESIAPRRVVFPDGKVMVWRCPDNLIPGN